MKVVKGDTVTIHPCAGWTCLKEGRQLIEDWLSRNSAYQECFESFRFFLVEIISELSYLLFDLKSYNWACYNGSRNVCPCWTFMHNISVSSSKILQNASANDSTNALFSRSRECRLALHLR